MDSDTIKDIIVNKYYERKFLENPILTGDGLTFPLQFKTLWDNFMSRNHERFNKIVSLLLVEYNPLNNVEGYTYTKNEIGQRKDTFVNGATETRQTNAERNAETQGFTSSFDSSSSNLPTTKTTAKNESFVDKVNVDSSTDSKTTDSTEDNMTEFKFGNIGVTKTTDLIESALELNKYNIYDFILAEFMNEITIY